MNEISARIVSRVRYLRAQRKMSANALAEVMTAAGFPITQAQITNREVRLRRSTVTADDLVGFSRVLGVPIEDLIAESHCVTCDDVPPPRFTCNDCGKAGGAT